MRFPRKSFKAIIINYFIIVFMQFTVNFQILFSPQFFSFIYKLLLFSLYHNFTTCFLLYGRKVLILSEKKVIQSPIPNQIHFMFIENTRKLKQTKFTEQWCRLRVTISQVYADGESCIWLMIATVVRLPSHCLRDCRWCCFGWAMWKSHRKMMRKRLERVKIASFGTWNRCNCNRWMLTMHYHSRTLASHG